jgi:hypothetical protein
MSMESQRKKVIVLAVIIFFVLLFGAIFFFLNRPGSVEEEGIGGDPFGSSAEFGIIPAESPFSGQADFAQGAVSGFEKGVVRRLSDTPVSGATSFVRGSSTIIRYMEQATGHVFDVDLMSGERARISNETIPVVRHAEWLPGEGGYYVAFQEDDGEVISFLSRVNFQATTSTSTRRVLGTNILSATPSTDGVSFFVVAREPSGAVGYLLNARTGAERKVWSFPTSEWDVSPLVGGRFALTTSASRLSDGFMFILDPINNRFEKVLGGIPGLSVSTSQSGVRFFSSKSVVGGIGSSMTTARDNQEVSASAALADKCAWKKEEFVVCGSTGAFSDSLPDSWYQGSHSFRDSLFMTDGSVVQLISNLSDHDARGMDVENPFISQDDRFFVFRNKKDGILWAAEIPALTAEEEESSDPSSGTTTPGR